jgi:hypothetical protein
MEAEKKQARQADAKSVLTRSKSPSSGNRRDIVRYKADDFEDDASKRELGRLQKEAEIAQSSNLLNAEQNAAITANGGQTFDTGVAQQQIKKLQAAQELGVTRIQPLHVNLPTRGVHYGFNQVLQTEVHKAMTVQFSAANLRATGWFMRVFAIAGAFVVLWIVAGIVLARRKAQAN